MRVVVVGGIGNISSAVVSLLLEHGHDVTVYTRGSRPAPDGVRVLVGDRNDRPEFEATMREGDFDVAIDMIGFTRADAESSLRAFPGVQQLIHTSTIVVYGEARDHLFTGEAQPTLATQDYGRNKAEADACYLTAHERDGYPVTIFRPSNAYGGPGFGAPRQVGVSAEWIDRVRKGKPLVVCGDGLALSRFLHVRDAALAYVGAIGRSATIGQVYNLVDPRIFSWADYHREAMRAIGREVELVGVPFETLRAFDVPGFGLCEMAYAHHWIHDDAKVRRDIPEFRPRVGLADGIAQAVELTERAGGIPDSDAIGWEDDVIAAQRGASASAKR